MYVCKLVYFLSVYIVRVKYTYKKKKKNREKFCGKLPNAVTRYYIK